MVSHCRTRRFSPASRRGRCGVIPRMATRFRHAALVGKYQAEGIRASARRRSPQFLVAQGLEVSLERDTALNTGITDYAALDAGRARRSVRPRGGGRRRRHHARHRPPARAPRRAAGRHQPGPAGLHHRHRRSDELREALAPMLAGDYEEEHRSDARRRRAGATARRIFDGLAMNDVVVSRGATAGMVELRDRHRRRVRRQPARRRPDHRARPPARPPTRCRPAGRSCTRASPAGCWCRSRRTRCRTGRSCCPTPARSRIEIVAGRDASVNFDMQSLASLLHGDRIRVRRSAHQRALPAPARLELLRDLRRKLHWYEGVG